MSYIRVNGWRTVTNCDFILLGDRGYELHHTNNGGLCLTNQLKSAKLSNTAAWDLAPANPTKRKSREQRVLGEKPAAGHNNDLLLLIREGDTC